MAGLLALRRAFLHERQYCAATLERIGAMRAAGVRPSLRVSSLDLTAVLALVGSTAYLYLCLFILPAIPILVGPDGPVLMGDAKRMLEGQVLYRDFFQFSTPGTGLVYYILYKLFGVHTWIPNALLLVIGLTFAWLSIRISRKVMSARMALLPGALFLTIPFARFLDGTHHWFSGLAVVAAIAVLIEKRTPARIALAGALCGLALCFTQMRGLMSVLGIGAFLFWEGLRNRHRWREHLKNQTILCGSFLAAVAAVSAYFVWKAGLDRFIYGTVLFGTEYYGADPVNNFHAFLAGFPPIPPWGNLPSTLAWFFLYGLIPLIYVLFLARYWRDSRRRPQEHWHRLMLLAIVGLFLFISVAPAPALYRVCAGSLPALILLAWFVDSRDRLNRTVASLLWLGVVLAAGAALPRHFRSVDVLEAPTGRVAIFNPVIYQKYHWLTHHTQAGEYFYEGFTTDAYTLLDLRNPTPVPFLSNTDYTRPEQVAAVIRGLEAHQVRLVVWSPANANTPVPGSSPSGNHLEPLEAYLQTHYRVVRVFPSGEQVWKRYNEPFVTHKGNPKRPRSKWEPQTQEAQSNVPATRPAW